MAGGSLKNTQLHRVRERKNEGEQERGVARLEVLSETLTHIHEIREGY